MTRSTAPIDTPIGRLWAVTSDAGLVEITRADLPPPGTEVDEAACASALEELAAYFVGRLRAFSLPLDLAHASRFDTRVWHAAQAIPYGQTASYGELALMAARPGAARAVGNAMARCPLTPVVPCHRVIHADGSIGGWGGSTWVKRWLLDMEARHA